MENLNIDQYRDKVDGMVLPAEEWNGVLLALQEKINELVSASNELDDHLVVNDTEVIVNSGLHLYDGGIEAFDKND